MNVAPAVLLLAAVLCLTGCVRPTVVHVSGQGAVRGHIESSDAENVYVSVGKNLKPRAVPRQDIIEVDHSGSITRFVGMPIALVGAGVLTYAVFLFDPGECEGACIDATPYIALLGGAIATAGLFTSIVGFIEYGDSTSHFDDVPATTASGTVSFGVAPTQDGAAAGVTGTF